MTVTALIRRAQLAQERYDHRNAVQLSIRFVEEDGRGSGQAAVFLSGRGATDDAGLPRLPRPLSTSGPDPSALGVAQPAVAASGPASVSETA